MATGRESGVAASYVRLRIHSSNEQCGHTGNHRSRVVDDALVVLVRTVREVHAHCSDHEQQSHDLFVGVLTDVDTSAYQLAQHLNTVHLWT